MTDRETVEEKGSRKLLATGLDWMLILTLARVIGQPSVLEVAIPKTLLTALATIVGLVSTVRVDRAAVAIFRSKAGHPVTKRTTTPVGRYLGSQCFNGIGLAYIIVQYSTQKHYLETYRSLRKTRLLPGKGNVTPCCSMTHG